jgi:signal transduction histidine kinase
MQVFPVPANEDDRLAALKSYNILDTAEELDFDELTTLASAICQTPIALVSLVDDKRQWFKSHLGLAAKETPKEQSFCAHAIVGGDDIMIIEDARTDARFMANPLVTGDLSIVFYAGVPLVNEDGFALGSLCVIDHELKKLTDAQITALKILAKQVITKLEVRRKVIILERLNQELRDANVFIQKFASMAAHDIKNPISSILLASQALKVRLQKLGDAGSERLIDLNISSTKNLIVLIDEMQGYSKSPSLLLSKKQDVNLSASLKKIMTMVTIPGNFEVNLPDEKHTIHVSAVALEQIFMNLISNAIRYNKKEHGVVNIRYNEDNNFYKFEIEDNGIGIHEQYHEKIFHNNFTLAVTDRYDNKGTGIGLSTVKELVKALRGHITLKSTPGIGTTFFVTIKK